MGQYYTGAFSYLFFANDHDVSSPTGESYFSNIEIYEDVPPPDNQPPSVTTTSTTLDYTENDAATVVDAGVAVTDADDVTLASATVSITGNFVAGEDQLAFADTLVASGHGQWRRSDGDADSPGRAIADACRLSGSVAVGDVRQSE